MHSISQLLDMVATDASAQLTHQCHGCGRVISPDGDGCPHCGRNADVTLLSRQQLTEGPETGSEGEDAGGQ